MDNFDSFCTDLLEQAKRFLEKYKETNNKDAKRAFLNSSLLLTISSLEAFVNGISSELMHIPQLTILEKSILSEKEFTIKKGKFELSNQLRIYRITERIEFLYFKFTKKQLRGNEYQWWTDLLNSIDLRNKIVHPKEDIVLTQNHVETAIYSVLSCVDNLYQAIYSKKLPMNPLGLKSRYDF